MEILLVYLWIGLGVGVGVEVFNWCLGYNPGMGNKYRVFMILAWPYILYTLIKMISGRS